MAYLDRVLLISSTVEAEEVTQMASMWSWSWFAKDTTYQPYAYVGNCARGAYIPTVPRISTLMPFIKIANGHTFD